MTHETRRLPVLYDEPSVSGKAPTLASADALEQQAPDTQPGGVPQVEPTEVPAAWAPAATYWEALFETISDGVYFVDIERRILRWNRAAEQLTGYTANDMKRLRCSDGFLCHIDEDGGRLCGRGCPLVHAMRDGRPVEAHLYLLHRDGHRVPVIIRVAPVHDAEGRLLGAVETFSETIPITSTAAGMGPPSSSQLDPQTGAATRTYGEGVLRSRLADFAREGWPLGVLAIEVDHADWVLQTYGANVGGNLMRMVARTIRGSVRQGDMVALWSGTTFVAIMSKIDAEGLYQQANRIRMLVERSGLSQGIEVIRTTTSLGATLAKHEDSADSLVDRGMQLMQNSRRMGGGCISTDVQRRPRSIRPPR